MIHTSGDLLVPPNVQDTRCFLRRVDVTEGQSTTNTSSFTPQLWKPERFPPSAHLCEDFTIQNALALGCYTLSVLRRPSRKNRFHEPVGPQFHAQRCYSQYLSDLVCHIYHALTGQELEYRAEQHVSFSQVISDFAYRVGDGVHILGGAKFPKAFNHFIGELMGQMRDGSPAQFCFESVPTPYDGYKAILGKVLVVASVSRLLSESCPLLGIMRATFSPASVGQTYPADFTISLFTSHGH
jgi:hypothetical protein